MKLIPAAGTIAAFLRKHPYCTLAAACLLAGAVFSPMSPKLLSGSGALLLVAGGLLLVLAFWLDIKQAFRKRPLAACLGTAAGLLCAMGFFAGEQPAVYLFTLCLLAVWLAALYLISQDALQTWHIALFLAFLSFALHFSYISYTAYYSFQHDLGEPAGLYGHLPYIEYFNGNHFQLPQFDLRERFGFQNPPLHHLLAALWLQLAAPLNRDYAAALESLQILTLLYSGWVTLTGYKLLRELELDGAALLVPFAVICAHPTLVIFSGLLNNDVLCLALMMQAALFAIRWYKNPSVPEIIKIAVCIGLAMFTKSSGAMVAPGVALLFLARLTHNKPTTRKKLMAQFVVFGCICIPLALWWNLYYYFKFGTPLFYVPYQGDGSFQYIGDYPVWQRLFDLSPHQFQNLFHNWEDPYNEYSIPVTILKTSVFGEFQHGYNPYVGIPSVLLFFSNVGMVILSLVATVYGLAKKQSGQSRMIHVFLGVFWLAVTGSYVKFCFDFPHSCTMNYRYIGPTFLIGCCFIGTLLKGLRASSKTAARYLWGGIYALCGVFCVSSCLFWMAVGLKMW